MSKSSRSPLKPNPFVSFRDPKTGQWRVVFPVRCETQLRTAQ